LHLFSALVALLVVIVPVSTAGSAMASPGQPDPARLTADRVTVDMETRRALAEGNVRLVHGDVQIACDRLEVDTSSGDLVADGNVELRDGDDVVRGDALRYNLRTKSGSVSRGRATVTGDGMSGELYVSGEGFDAEPGKITVTNGIFTSCDLEEPHYHVEAGEIEVYVDDRIVLRNVSYWEGKLRLFHWPYLVLPIREENRFELPKIGYGSSEGWFVKTAYNYYRSESSRGSLHLDYLSKLGVGAGVKHLYEVDPLGSGFLYAYGVANRLTRHVDSKFEISHDISLGKETRAHLGLRYGDAVSSTGVSNTELKGVLELDHSDERGFIDLVVERTANRGERPKDETRASASARRKFEEGLSLSANAAYLDSRALEGNSESSERFLNYKADVSKDTSLGSIRAVWEQYVKPSEREEQEEEGEVEPLPYEAIGRAPEVTFESRPFVVGGLPLKLQLAAIYGKYAERPSGWAGPGVVKAAKTGLALRAPSQSYELSKSTRATVSAGIAFDSYTTGDSRYVASASLGVETRAFGELLRLKGGYEYRGVFGETPFAFDSEGRKGLLTGSLSLARNPVTASIEGGYDLYTRVYKDLVGRVRVSPGREWAVEGWASYDPNEAAMKEVVGKIEISASERCTVKVGARYSFAAQAFDRVESDVDLSIGEAWKLQCTVVYGGPSKSVLRGNVGVTRDLHCRELKLSYSYTDNQVWLEYRIKAFPYEGVRFGLGDQGILF
jgi:lipopolysaccharide export system protein LptA